MSDFGDDFGDIGQLPVHSGVLPSYPTVPTDIRQTRSFLFSNNPLPRMYYDLYVQEKRRQQQKSR